MCAPLAVVGVATAVTGIVGSIGQYSQAQAQADAQNRAQQEQYQAQLEQYEYQNKVQQQQYQLQTQAWQRQEEAAKRQVQLNNEAAMRSYQSEQAKVDAAYKRAALEADNLRLKSMQDASSIQASGKTGRSIGVLAMDPDREYGRDLAVLGLNLGFTNADYYNSVGTIFEQATSANNQVQSGRSPAPSAPIVAPKPKAPSSVSGGGGFSLAAGILGAGLSGYQAYQSLQAPDVRNPINIANIA